MIQKKSINYQQKKQVHPHFKIKKWAKQKCSKKCAKNIPINNIYYKCTNRYIGSNLNNKIIIINE